MPGPNTLTIEFSLVAPAHNEEDNIDRLVEESRKAMESLGVSYEFVIVDDGSTDSTRARIVAAMTDRPWLRCVGMTSTPPGKGNGQSAAFHAGFRAARGRWIATLDADLPERPGGPEGDVRAPQAGAGGHGAGGPLARAPG